MSGPTDLRLRLVLRAICGLSLPVPLFTHAAPASWTDGQNLVPNATFAGNGGLLSGNVAGNVPDCWRGFAIAPGAEDITLVPLSANALIEAPPPEPGNHRAKPSISKMPPAPRLPST